MGVMVTSYNPFKRWLAIALLDRKPRLNRIRVIRIFPHYGEQYESSFGQRERR